MMARKPFYVCVLAVLVAVITLFSTAEGAEISKYGSSDLKSVLVRPHVDRVVIDYPTADTRG